MAGARSFPIPCIVSIYSTASYSERVSEAELADEKMEFTWMYTHVRRLWIIILYFAGKDRCWLTLLVYAFTTILFR